MTSYRRLISYIYAYEGKIKGRNIGFAKLESRNGQCRLSVNVKKVYVGGSDLRVYLLAPEKEIFLGNIFIRGGAGEFRTSVPVDNVAESGIAMDRCYGLSIHEKEDSWRSYTTIWEDEVAQAAEVELEEVTSDKLGDPDEKLQKKVEELEQEIAEAENENAGSNPMEASGEPVQETDQPAAATTDAQEGAIDVQLMSSSSSSGFGDFDLGDFGSLEDMMANMPAAPDEDASALEKFWYMVDMLDFLNECLGMISGILTEMGDQLILAGMEMADSMEGLTDFDLDAVTELQEGMVLLADNYGEFNEGLGLYLEGVAAVAEGLGTYASGMYALNSETQAIPDMVDALLGTGDEEEEESGPVSFLSEENEDTAAVQFVLSTEGIAAPEAEEEPAPPAEEEQGFFGDLWDKVVNLF